MTKEQEQVTKEQEQDTPQGIEVQETPHQSLGETLTNNEGYYDPILDFLNDSNLDFLNDPDLDFDINIDLTAKRCCHIPCPHLITGEYAHLIAGKYQQDYLKLSASAFQKIKKTVISAWKTFVASNVVP